MTARSPRTARSGSDLRLLRAAVFAAVCVALAAAGHTLGAGMTVPPWTLGVGFLAVLAVVVPLAGRSRSLPGIVVLLAVGQTVLHTLFGLGQVLAGTMSMGAMSMNTTATGSAGSVPTGSLSAGATAAAAGGSAHALGSLSDASLVEQAARLMCGASAAAISPAEAQRILLDARIYRSSGGTGAGTDAVSTVHQQADAVAGGSVSSTDWLSLLPSLPMLLGHLLAALAAGWLLRRGDTALLRLIALSAHGVAETALVRSLRAALALVRALGAGLPGAPSTGPRLWRRTAPPTLPAPRTEALQHTVIRRGPPAVGALSAFVLAA
ncbi:hypothetical protein [Streptomyces sp. NPDC008150]|uniref:hypothetical protein n=1 Tax=Streptomyces sp. NPDC008150 TaxID=3364816 RepID=UPI0036EB90FF